MNMQSVEGLQRRTDAKIRYARVHFEELRPMRPLDSSDFGRAHQESFLFHLFGARDALIAELNVYYGIGLPPDDLTAGKLRSALESRGLKSPELVKLRELEDDEASWFRWMKDMRDHSTHRQGVARAYFMSGLVKLKHPATGQLTERDLIDEFDAWLVRMEELVLALRASAHASNAP